jgi:hypothetical protein
MADSNSYDGTMQKFRKQIEEIHLVRGPQEDLHSRKVGIATGIPRASVLRRIDVAIRGLTLQTLDAQSTTRFCLPEVEWG